MPTVIILAFILVFRQYIISFFVLELTLDCSTYEFHSVKKSFFSVVFFVCFFE